MGGNKNALRQSFSVANRHPAINVLKQMLEENVAQYLQSSSKRGNNEYNYALTLKRHWIIPLILLLFCAEDYLLAQPSIAKQGSFYLCEASSGCYQLCWLLVPIQYILIL